MDADLHEKVCKSVVQSTNDVFNVFFGEPSLEVSPDVMSTEELICSVGFVGTIEGNLSVGLSKKVACAIVGKMLATDYADLCPDVLDGCGEIANLITGGFKSRMIGPEIKIDISIPTVVTGQQIHMSPSGKNPMIRKSFQCGAIPFSIFVTYKKHEMDDKNIQTKIKPSASELLRQMMNKAS